MRCITWSIESALWNHASVVSKSRCTQGWEQTVCNCNSNAREVASLWRHRQGLSFRLSHNRLRRLPSKTAWTCWDSFRLKFIRNSKDRSSEAVLAFFYFLFLFFYLFVLSTDFKREKNKTYLKDAEKISYYKMLFGLHFHPLHCRS